MLVLGVALLAGFLFIGGGAAIYLSTPPQPANSNLSGLIGDLASVSPSPLPAFTQETAAPEATPEPTPTPFFFSPDPGSFVPASFDVTPSATPIVIVTPTPTPIPGGPTPTPTARPTHGPTPTPRPTNNPTPTPRPTNNPTPTPRPTNNPTPTPQPSAPKANFSVSENGLDASFTNTSTGTGLSYAWDFGDPSTGGANTSTQKNPKHHFSFDGSYQVTLTVTDSLGRTASRTKTVVVAGSTPSPTPTDAPTPTPTPTDTSTPPVTTP